MRTQPRSSGLRPGWHQSEAVGPTSCRLYPAAASVSQPQPAVIIKDTARLLWDSHAAVFYYGAAFAVVGSVALLMLVAEEGGKHKQTKISGSN